MVHATTWVNLENIMLSERSQTQKAVYCMSPLIWNVQNRQLHRNRRQICGWQGLVEGRTASWVPGFFGGGENGLQLDSELCLHKIAECIKRHWIATLKCLKWWISWYMNFTSKKSEKKLGCLGQLRAGEPKPFYRSQSGTYIVKPHGEKTEFTNWATLF